MTAMSCMWELMKSQSRCQHLIQSATSVTVALLVKAMCLMNDAKAGGRFLRNRRVTTGAALKVNRLEPYSTWDTSVCNCRFV